MRNYTHGSYDYQNLFKSHDTKKNWIIKITLPGATSVYAELTNDDIYSSGATITESICDESQLMFGGCIASEFKATISATAVSQSQKLIGATLDVYILLGDDTGSGIKIGTYVVDSEKKASNGNERELIAYDKLFELGNVNVAEWYEGIFEDTESVTLASFRNSLMTYLGITQETVQLPNDAMTIEKTIEGSEIPALTVLRKICEINGVFGRIDYNGIFKYIRFAEMVPPLYPNEALYPSEDLYPSDGSWSDAIKIGKSYIGGYFENFTTKNITGVQIKQEDEDVGVLAGSDINLYVIQDNFLCYGKSTEDLTTIAQRFFNAVKVISYMPYTMTATGNPCYELGDALVCDTINGTIRSLIFKRILHGGQAIWDDYSAEGEETRGEIVTTQQSEIKQLKGKQHKIINTIEEHTEEISDLETGYSRISQTVSSISATVSDLDGDVYQLQLSVNGLSSRVTTTEGNYSTLSQTVSGIDTKVGTLEGNYSTLSQTVSGISTKVGTLEGNYSSLSQTVSSISAEVSGKVDESELTASFVIGIINGQSTAQISASRIDLSGYVTFSNLSTAGQTTIDGGNITAGSIHADSISWTTAGGASYTGDIAFGTMSGGSVQCGSLDVNGDAVCENLDVSVNLGVNGDVTCDSLLQEHCYWIDVTIDGTSHKLLCAD